jgi:hypothetical protein
MTSPTWLLLTTALVVLSVAAVGRVTGAPSSDLKIVILRHGEKSKTGQNLSCQGLNRALRLPEVLARKFDKPSYTYVSAMRLGEATKHTRMFETVAPFAIKEDLTVNSSFDESNVLAAAREVLMLHGTVLMVWDHSHIVPLARALGVREPPHWRDDDFDSIWVITFPAGKTSMSMDREDIAPAPDCPF